MANLTANILTFSNYNTITLNKTNNSMVEDTDILTYSISNIGADKSLSVRFTLYPNTLTYPYKLYVPSGANITFTDLGKFNLTDEDGNAILKDVVITPLDDLEFGIEFVSSVTLTINPTPSDAVVTLTADGYTQEGNSITVVPGTEVNYKIDNPITNYYGWDNNGSTYYTLSSIPSVGDVLYDENGKSLQKTIIKIDNDGIYIG